MKHLVCLLLSIAATGVQAQSSCSSDGQRTPVAVVERFTSADCDSCWSDTTARPAPPRTLVLDWIVPSPRGDEAPLSAAATRDAHARLAALHRTAPTTSRTTHTPVAKRPYRMRVAHGLPFNDYIGASMELPQSEVRPLPQPVTGWLVLVETIAAGTDGTAVERNLVRNVLSRTWGMREQLSKDEQKRLFESRPMGLGATTRPERLRVVGWAEDAQGHVVAAAQSLCVEPPADKK